MLYRSITERIEQFFEKEKKAALMVTGARQVGKTYCIREYAKQHFKYVIEINFLEMPQAVALFENATGSDDILMRISALTDIPMEKDRTMIFFDEVQECREIVTAIKFLVEEGSYRYILSGSLLGVELKDIRSVPVGYMSIYEMFPMDFFEFCKANRVSEKVLDKLKNCFEEKIPVDGLIRDKKLLLIDDSIVRGTTSDRIVKMLRDAGATEVHVRISSPPFLWPCYFGTDIPEREQLIAYNRSIEDIRKIIGADSLGYLGVERLEEMVGGLSICKGCFTGTYPMEPPKEDIRGDFER